MVDLAVLNGLLRKALPLEAEIPVLQVDDRVADQLISEDGIIVPRFY